MATPFLPVIMGKISELKYMPISFSFLNFPKQYELVIKLIASHYFNQLFYMVTPPT